MSATRTQQDATASASAVKPAEASVLAADAHNPTVWGLSPAQLHDRFWAARGVQVVRQGQRSEIVVDAELYMLTDPRTLTIFPMMRIIETLSWLSPDILFVRLHEIRDQGYREEVISDGQGQFKRFQRVYGGSDSRLARVALTPDREIAKIWQAAPDTVSGWRKLRRMLQHPCRSVTSVKSRVYDQTRPSDVRQFVRDLVSTWDRPDATINRPRRLKSTLWADVTTQHDLDRQPLGVEPSGRGDGELLA